MHTRIAAVMRRVDRLFRLRSARFIAFVLLTLSAGVLCQYLGEYIEPDFLVPPFHLPAPFAAVNTLFLAAAFGALTLEAVVVGWRKCSIRHLLVYPDQSTTTDVMYLCIWASGMMGVLSVVMTLGLTLYLTEQFKAWLGFGLLASAPVWVAAPLAVLWRSFTGYWEHRFAHSRWFWSLHKSHHSPADFTVLTAFREHPIEIAFGSLIYSISLAPLGLSAGSIVVMQIMAGIVPMYLHSKMYKLMPLEYLGIATPSGHRLHHSSADEHIDVNFGGTLNIWDRLFGTYVKPNVGVDRIPIGVDDSRLYHNTERPYHGIFMQTRLWLRALRREFDRLWSRTSDARSRASVIGEGSRSELH